MDLESHSHSRRCNFLRRDQDIFFLLSPGETRSRLSYDHSCISRPERDYILLYLCFEMRSRLKKIISCGRARKKWSFLPKRIPGIENSRWALRWDHFRTSKNSHCIIYIIKYCRRHNGAKGSQQGNFLGNIKSLILNISIKLQLQASAVIAADQQFVTYKIIN